MSYPELTLDWNEGEQIVHRSTSRAVISFRSSIISASKGIVCDAYSSEYPAFVVGREI